MCEIALFTGLYLGEMRPRNRHQQAIFGYSRVTHRSSASDEAEAFKVDAPAQGTVLSEVADRYHRRGEARGGADAERPTGADPISDPTDDRCADGGTSQGYREEDRHHTPAHNGLGRQLHQAVRRDGEGLGGHADDEESEPEEPAAGHDRGERAAEPEDCRGAEQKRDAGVRPPSRA